MRTKWAGQQQKLVWRNGVLTTMVREIYAHYQDPPWWAFWRPIKRTTTYSEPTYIPVPEINDESN